MIPPLPRLLCLLSLFLPLPAMPAPERAVTPPQTVVPFDGPTGKDLSAFSTRLPKFGRADPDCVFGVVTEENCTHCRLVAEFRRGGATRNPRTERARDCGIMRHGQGEDGGSAGDFLSPWTRSVEYRTIERGTGDPLVRNGYVRGSGKPVSDRVVAAVAANGKNWDPAGTPKEFAKGRIAWQHRDLGWKDALGCRGSSDGEKPAGDWNRIEAVRDGGILVHLLNGVKVLEATGRTITSGRLRFQSEGAENFSRRIELHPPKP